MAMAPPLMLTFSMGIFSSFIHAIGTGAKAGDLQCVSVEKGYERQITDLSGKYGKLSAWGLATDGNSVFFAWEEQLGDLWVMDVIWEKK